MSYEIGKKCVSPYPEFLAATSSPIDRRWR